MAKPATLKFAVVREDPEVELALIRRFTPSRALIVASGGCTALALAAARGDDLEVVAFDINPAQLAHVEAKRAAIARGALGQLNVDDADPRGLSQRGAFEALFRVLRQAIVELVAPVAELERFFAAATTVEDRAAELARWRASRYWPAVFEVAFNDPLLEAMFGPDATQHAAPGSYPAYFRGAFERGLARDDAGRNPFLHHVLLGRYVGAHAPSFLRAGRRLPLTLREGSLLDMPDLSGFGLVHLSNIFDWSSDAVVDAWAQALQALRPGAVIVIRQLNNRRALRERFAPCFVFDDALGAALLASDRSLFYERIEVGVRAG